MAGYEADGTEIRSEHESPFWNAAAAARLPSMSR